MNTTESFNGIENNIVNQLIENVSCTKTNNGEWEVKGYYIDSDGDKRIVSAKTDNEDMATGWMDDREDISVYNDYKRMWSEFLFDELELINAW